MLRWPAMPDRHHQGHCGLMTGSSAMLSEAIHSGADTGSQLLLYGLQRAKLPADHEFPFGHGQDYSEL